MRGMVSSVNLFNTGIAYIINLAATAAIKDPHLVWDFGALAIIGGIVTVVFVSSNTIRIGTKFRLLTSDVAVLPVPPH